LRIPLLLLPHTLGGRIFALYAANLLLFIGAGLGAFYHYQFNDNLATAQDSAQILGEVVTQTVSDSVVVGDYDAVKRTLLKAVRASELGSASFIDVKGGVVTVHSPVPPAGRAPAWLTARVTARLSDINNIVTVGGRDYGVLRLRFAPERIAENVWSLTTRALSIGAATLLVGLVLIDLSLRRWLGGLSRIREFDWGPVDRLRESGEAISPDAPVEIRETLASFQRAGAELRSQHETRKDALVSLRGALEGMLPEAELKRFEVSESDLGAVSRLVADLVRERESGRRALDNQMFALDQHASVSISDASGTITYVNDKFVEITGYGVAELIGSNHRITSSGLHPAEFYRDMWQTITAGKVWHGEITNRHKNGTLYWVATTIVPWLDEQGEPYQYIAIRTDITAQKEIELALAEARRRELETGYAIQRAMLIGEPPEGLLAAQAAGYSEPSQGIDGDFFAFTTLRPDCLELLVGDVMGKGVPAALVGAAVRTTYNQVVTELLAACVGGGELPAPEAIVNALHARLTPRLIELDVFVTLALYRFDFSAGSMRFVNAGHTEGLLLEAGGNLCTVLGDNLPVGVTLEERYVEQSRPFGPGDALVVHSDGITEACNATGEAFGEERMRALLAGAYRAGLPPSICLQVLRRAVRDFVGGTTMPDDQTAVMVAVASLAPGASAVPEVLELPWDAAKLEPLRLRVAQAAAALPAEAAHGLVLASFEAATNVVRHVAPPFPEATLACRIRRGADAVSVELWYLGEPFRPPAQPTIDVSGESEGGFGLYIMENAVSSVAYETPLPGTCCTRLTQASAPHAAS